MSSLHAWAESQPDRLAYYFPQTGDGLSYAELDARSEAIACWMAASGLLPGDGVVLLMDNCPRLFEITWAAKRAGVYFTPISRHLKVGEIAYILDNSGARYLISSPAYTALAATALDSLDGATLTHFGIDSNGIDGVIDFDTAVTTCDARPDLSARPIGRELLYSSGTTGVPKGVCKPMWPAHYRDEVEPDVAAWQRLFDVDDNTVYLSTGPLYHAAPLAYSMRTVSCGGRCIVLGRFAAEDALAAIEAHRVTHSQWVPTMFVRLLDLPEAMRARYDLSSQQRAIHAAAPCPIHIKTQMIDWWGPIVWEYYAGSEGIGQTLIGPEQWQDRKGSVGPAVIGELHILDDDGNALPAGEVGTIYFANGPRFEYRNDPEKTASVYRADGMATLGDLGYIDAEGFLFLSDRRADLIISGGVNIYPKEIEDVLQRHPAVADCAVIGVADPEYGESVMACVLPAADAEASDAMAARLIDFCREHLSHIKCPKRVVFLAESPRTETGKIPRRLLKARYRDTGESDEPGSAQLGLSARSTRNL